MSIRKILYIINVLEIIFLTNIIIGTLIGFSELSFIRQIKLMSKREYQKRVNVHNTMLNR